MQHNKWNTLSKDGELNVVGIALGSAYLTLQNIISTTIGVFLAMQHITVGVALS